MQIYKPRATLRPDDARAFVDAVRDASALIIASPGYHGSSSGVVKNALDLLQETARDERPYLADMPVGLITTPHGWQATGSTIAALRSRSEEHTSELQSLMRISYAVFCLKKKTKKKKK